MDSIIVHRNVTKEYAEFNAFERAVLSRKISSLGYGFLAIPALPRLKLEEEEAITQIKAVANAFAFPPKFVVFSTASLNIVINQLIAYPSYVVEVEKGYETALADELRKIWPKKVFLNPTESELKKNWDHGMVCVYPLLSKAPVSEDGSYRVEKLIVDLILSWRIQVFYSGIDIDQALYFLTHDYEVNFHTLFAYAKRKGKAKEVYRVLQEVLKEPYQEVLHAIKEKL
ncbi:MAG: hypothetical protein IJU64_05490 [Bacilli bacterium]|nr:hypothetical protein [Bacilli bacterium]